VTDLVASSSRFRETCLNGARWKCSIHCLWQCRYQCRCHRHHSVQIPLQWPGLTLHLLTTSGIS